MRKMMLVLALIGLGATAAMAEGSAPLPTLILFSDVDGTPLDEAAMDEAVGGLRSDNRMTVDGDGAGYENEWQARMPRTYPREVKMSDISISKETTRDLIRVAGIVTLAHPMAIGPKIAIGVSAYFLTK